MSRGLIIIDMQRDYFPGGKMELVGADEASAKAHDLLAAFRESGEPLVHVRHEFAEADAPFFVAGSPGAEIHPAVEPLPGETVITKEEANAFLGTGLEDLLREKDIDEVVVCGMMTSMCVDASVRAATDLGFKATIAADACAAPTLPSGDNLIDGRTVHNAFLAALGTFVAEVRPTDEIIGS